MDVYNTKKAPIYGAFTTIAMLFNKMLLKNGYVKVIIYLCYVDIYTELQFKQRPKNDNKAVLTGLWPFFYIFCIGTVLTELTERYTEHTETRLKVIFKYRTFLKTRKNGKNAK